MKWELLSRWRRTVTRDHHFQVEDRKFQIDKVTFGSKKHGLLNFTKPKTSSTSTTESSSSRNTDLLQTFQQLQVWLSTESRDRNTSRVSHFIAIFLFWNPMVFLSAFSLSDPPPLCQKTGRSRGLKSTQESLLVWEFSNSEINATEIHEWILSTPVIRNVLGYSIMIAFRTRAHLVADLGAIFTSGINSLNITQNVWNDDDSLDQKHQQ